MAPSELCRWGEDSHSVWLILEEANNVRRSSLSACIKFHCLGIFLIRHASKERAAARAESSASSLFGDGRLRIDAW